MARLSFPLQMGVCLASDQRLDSSNSVETTRADDKPTEEENRHCKDSFYPKVLCVGNLRHVAPYFLQKTLEVGKLANGKTIGQALGIDPDPINHKSTVVKDVALVDWWPKELLANRLQIVNTPKMQPPNEQQVIHNSTIRIATPDHVIQEGDVLRGRYHFHEQSVLDTPRPTIVYQDENYIVVNKPGGIDVLSNPDAHRVVNSLPGIVMGILDRADSHCDGTTEQSLPSSSFPPKPIVIIPAHRIDNPVSGLVCCGKSNKDAKRLSRKIQSRETIKTYLARVRISSDRAMELLQKKPPLDIELPLSFDSSRRCAVVDFSKGGKPSKTSILAVLQEAASNHHPSGTCVIAVRPHTGRKHQLRKHLSHVGLPIANDEKYNTTASIKDDIDANSGGDCFCSEYSSRSISAFGLPNPPKEVVKLFEDHYLDHCDHCQYVRRLLGTTKAKSTNATPENLAATTAAKENMGPSVSQPIWLHSWRYKFPSLGLSFEAPPPEWAQLRQSMDGTILLHNGVLD